MSWFKWLFRPPLKKSEFIGELKNSDFKNYIFKNGTNLLMIVKPEKDCWLVTDGNIFCYCLLEIEAYEFAYESFYLATFRKDLECLSYRKS